MTQQISHYQIIEELGRGGMATVYRALDTRFEREVALKILPPYFMHDSDFPRRFRREAKFIASLEHKAIVPVYDYGEEDGRAFLAMRYMKGGSLAEKIASGALSLDETMPILERVAAALDFAHSKGVVHRDLKPGNILFDEFGEAFLADFGIAKLAEETSTFTNSGDMLGTPAYMSPEQIQGKKPDSRSDIYALGIILFEILSGQQPYQSETPTGLWYMHIHEPIPSLHTVSPALPKSVDNVIQKALSKDPTQRYQSGADLIDALIIKNAEAFILLTKPTNRRKKGLVWGVFGLILLLILGWRSFCLFGNLNNEPVQIMGQSGTPSPKIVVELTDTTNTSILSATPPSTKTLEYILTQTPVRNLVDKPIIELTDTRKPTITPSKQSNEITIPTSTSVIINLTTPVGGGHGQLLYTSRGKDLRGIHMINVDGSNQVNLTQNNEYAEFPNWSPDGSQLIFTSSRDKYEGDIYVMNIDDSSLTNLTQNPGNYHAPVWSPDGSQIAFWLGIDGKWILHIMNADGSNQFSLNQEGNSYDIDWSPDGSQIAFSIYSSSWNHDIYVINTDGSNLKRLTNYLESDSNPVWSPDGSQIAFTSNRDGNYNVYVMNADGSNQVNLSQHRAGDFSPVWSPNGNQIVFTSSRNGNSEIYIMNADGSNQINLTQTWENESHPVWSPDGSQIAFSSYSGAVHNGIYTLNISGNNLTKLINNDDNEEISYEQPIWRP